MDIATYEFYISVPGFQVDVSQTESLFGSVLELDLSHFVLFFVLG
jgi:hypothetical protein